MSNRVFDGIVHFDASYFASLARMIASENCAAVGAFVLAASKLDAWAIVANPRLSPRELDLIYDHSGARRLFFTTAVSKEAADHDHMRERGLRWQLGWLRAARNLRHQMLR